jgi:DNA-binding transcriptional ArsR family regulator
MVQHRSPLLDRVFHALAHPARRTMLGNLAQGKRNLTELAAPLRMTFAAASKHVRVLESAKLVKRRVQGRMHWCRIEAKPLEEVNVYLEKLREIWEGNFQRLDALLEEMKSQSTETTEKPTKRSTS